MGACLGYGLLVALGPGMAFRSSLGKMECMYISLPSKKSLQNNDIVTKLYRGHPTILLIVTVKFSGLAKLFILTHL